ncbi:phage putative head morphogenesis protein, SPP1 gp7 family [Gottschalkia purinilytica]|uniref:Phage putative head morphogenesis protein, SPP1 gp7 family n=2 Tax=Gottschalkia purinilytica TaxID=1503 RepID=A0A0L0WD15_GOTPU|nr:phage putative head morphogenesis protein, SPP1 gp7 family [Gottschalkia purinilytica]
MTVEERAKLYQKTEQLIQERPELARFTEVRYSYYKLQRLEGLHADMLLQLYEMGAIEEEILYNRLATTYKDSYYKSLYNNAMYYEITRKYNTVDKTILDMILNKRWVAGKNFSERIWKATSTLSDILKNEFGQMLASGTSLDKMTKRLKELFNTKWHEAERLVRTESAFVVEQANLNAYKEDGIQEYKFLATLDTRTSKKCRGLDGKVFKIIEAVEGVNYPPVHPYCRSTTISAMSKPKYRAMNIGRGYERIEFMKYDDWYNKYIRAS